MARILLSLVSGVFNPTKLPCFYEGLVNALLREGNEVVLMVTNQFHVNAWEKNELSPYLQEKYIKQSIQTLNPDLVIAFNNSLYKEIPRLLDCPIAVWAVDSPPLFADIKSLKKNINRYQVICSTEDMYPSVREYFNPKPSNLYTIPFASDFIAETFPQDKNISFIGTNFTASEKIKNFLSQKLEKNDVKENFKKFIESYKKNLLNTPSFHLKQLGIKNKFIDLLPHSDFLNIASSNFRIQVLQSVCDLGLHLYGSKNWSDVFNYSLDLALSYNSHEISSVKDNQDLYNQSKIAINITHAQAGKGFGWRVRDVMATNACLVSDEREDLIKQFGEYVKIPTYQTPLEAREICQRLLKDEVWRKEVVLASQLAINNGHRFKHRLKDLESIFGIQLFNQTPGGLLHLHAHEYMSFDDKLRYENGALKVRLSVLETTVANAVYSKVVKFIPSGLKNIIKKFIF